MPPGFDMRYIVLALLAIAFMASANAAVVNGNSGTYIKLQLPAISPGQGDVVTALAQNNDGLQVLINGIAVTSGRGTITFNINDINPPLGVGAYNITARDTLTGSSSSVTLTIGSPVQLVPPGIQSNNQTNITKVSTSTQSYNPALPYLLAVELALLYLVVIIGYYRYIKSKRNKR